MGSFLSQPWTKQETSADANEKLEYGCSAMQGWRRNMEDAHTTILDIDEDTSFFGVFDGHRGAEVARYAARHLHEKVLSSEEYSKGDIPAALISSFLSLDAQMLTMDACLELQRLNREALREDLPASRAEAARVGGPLLDLYEARIADIERFVEDSQRIQRENWQGPLAGSVALVAVVRGTQLFVASAGDARCVLCRDGTAVEMSKDHKPTVKEEWERITAAGGRVIEGRVNGSLSLSRALGDMDHKRNAALPPESQLISAKPDVRTMTLGPTDEFIILACDGIWDVMSSDGCVQFLRQSLQKGKTPSESVASLLEHCVALSLSPIYQGYDNMTAILVTLKPPLTTPRGTPDPPTPDNPSHLNPSKSPQKSDLAPTPPSPPPPPPPSPSSSQTNLAQSTSTGLVEPPQPPPNLIRFARGSTAASALGGGSVCGGGHAPSAEGCATVAPRLSTLTRTTMALRSEVLSQRCRRARTSTSTLAGTASRAAVGAAALQRCKPPRATMPCDMERMRDMSSTVLSGTRQLTGVPVSRPAKLIDTMGATHGCLPSMRGTCGSGGPPKVVRSHSLCSRSSGATTALGGTTPPSAYASNRVAGSTLMERSLEGSLRVWSDVTALMSRSPTWTGRATVTSHGLLMRLI